ncbi:hypothetical protein M407DRAFT_26437 [Tulasnella calospora MUT 4182]|uniref:Uncharacterized protein n=1 Tax=Tulasnella calospora MUT 4182 TaxID=1051891 RepID=A0A0C3KRT5_9AGAM|nr:hypothetical protein M407DRAFT_26437 [Tulasnella calospora MUT 4182]
MGHKILDFSLGTEGKYYLVWKDGNETRMETSPGLWEYLNVDFQGGSIRKLQFGAEGTVWGIRSFKKYRARNRGSKINDRNPFREFMVEATSGSETYTVQEEPFGQFPDTLAQKISEIYPSMEHSDQVDFVAVGKGGSWVMGAMQGLCFWDRIEGKLLRDVLKLYNKGGGLMNVVVAPTMDSLYIIETQDGTIHYRVFDEWDPQIRKHLQPSNTPSWESGASRTKHSPRAHYSQPESPPRWMKSEREGTRSGGNRSSGNRPASQRTLYAPASPRTSSDNEVNGVGSWSDLSLVPRASTSRGRSSWSSLPSSDYELGRPSLDFYPPNYPPPYMTYQPASYYYPHPDPFQFYPQNAPMANMYRMPPAFGFGAGGGGWNPYGQCGHYPVCSCQVQQRNEGDQMGMAAMMAGSTLVGAGMQVAAGMAGCTIM